MVKECFLSTSSAYWNDFEGSCDTEDMRNDCWKFSFAITGINNSFREQLFCILIVFFQNILFFYQINAAFVSINADFFKMHKKNHTNSKLLICSVCVYTNTHLGLPAVIHWVRQQVWPVCTEIQTCHRVSMTLHTVNQLVLSEVPYLQHETNTQKIICIQAKEPRHQLQRICHTQTFMSLSMPPEMIWSLVSLNVTLRTWYVFWNVWTEAFFLMSHSYNNTWTKSTEDTFRLSEHY